MECASQGRRASGRRLRAQTNAEFLVALAGVLLLVYILIIAEGGQKVNLQQSASTLETMKEAYEFAHAVNYVWLAGDGASYRFVFGERGTRVRMYEGYVEATDNVSVSTDALVTASVVPANISGGMATIRNRNGVITVEQ